MEQNFNRTVRLMNLTLEPNLKTLPIKYSWKKSKSLIWVTLTLQKNISQEVSIVFWTTWWETSSISINSLKLEKAGNILTHTIESIFKMLILLYSKAIQVVSHSYKMVYTWKLILRWRLSDHKQSLISSIKFTTLTALGASPKRGY